MNKVIKTIIKIIAILIVIVLIPAVGLLAYRETDEKGVVPVYNWNNQQEFNLDNVTQYDLDLNGEFKILQLTDPQFNLTLPLSGKTTKSISNLINESEPDLIIITGDVCGCVYNGIVYKQFVEFMDLFGIPYAVVFGNHDSEGRATKERLANILSEGEYSVFKYGPSNIKGIGNYVININNDDKIAWSLFMLDSNDYTDDKLISSNYDYIHQDQIDWYTWNVNKLKAINSDKLNSLAFFHIPLPEYTDAWDGKTDDSHHFGDKREDVCSSDYNSGLFDTMLELDSTRGIFVGHDHINDYSVTYKGIRLTYGLKTGHGSYGEEGVRGGLLITLNADDYTVEQLFNE